MAQPGFALVMYRLDGTEKISTIDSLNTDLYLPGSAVKATATFTTDVDEVVVRAVNAGIAGNSIVLDFTPSATVNAAIAAWNGANGGNQAELVSGTGTGNYAVGDITLSGGVAASNFAYGVVDIWTGRQWTPLTVAKADVSRHANLIKNVGSKEVKMRGTSGGGTYIGTDAKDINNSCRVLSKSYKVAVTTSSLADIGLLPTEIGAEGDHSPLGYAKTNSSFGGGLSLGSHTCYAIDTTITIAGATKTSGDLDGVYWSQGVIVDCEAVL